MPPGVWEKCGATTGKNNRGYSYRCNKKSGHTDKEHVDTKASPAYRWPVESSAQSTGE